MGKKIVVPCLGVIMIAFFFEKYTAKFSFCPTNARKYCVIAPWLSRNTPQL